MMAALRGPANGARTTPQWACLQPCLHRWRVKSALRSMHQPHGSRSYARVHQARGTDASASRLYVTGGMVTLCTYRGGGSMASERSRMQSDAASCCACVRGLTTSTRGDSEEASIRKPDSVCVDIQKPLRIAGPETQHSDVTAHVLQQSGWH